MIATLAAAYLAVKGDREKYFDFLYFGLIELMFELIALGMTLEIIYV